MRISEIKPGMKRIDAQGKITAIENPRDVQTKFGPGQVTAATVEDSTGAISVTLWNENVSKFNIGDLVSIENGYCDSFRGQLQLQVGRYGKIFKP